MKASELINGEYYLIEYNDELYFVFKKSNNEISVINYFGNDQVYKSKICDYDEYEIIEYISKLSIIMNIEYYVKSKYPEYLI